MAGGWLHGGRNNMANGLCQIFNLYSCGRARPRDGVLGNPEGRGHARENESVFVLHWRNETMTPTHFGFNCHSYDMTYMLFDMLPVVSIKVSWGDEDGFGPVDLDPRSVGESTCVPTHEVCVFHFFYFLVFRFVFQSNGPRLHEVFPEHNFILTCVLK